MNTVSSIASHRAGSFTILLLLINLVGDGWSQRHAGFTHQLILLPLLVLFLFSVWQLLFSTAPESPAAFWNPRRALAVAIVLELAFVSLFLHESHRFASMGYVLHPAITATFFLAILAGLVYLAFLPREKAAWFFVLSLTAS